MHMRDWLRPPRNLLVLFLGTTLVLTARLGWLGWRLLQQDRAVEAQHIRDRLDSAADLIAAEMRQTLSAAETQLTILSTLSASRLQESASAYAETLGDDAIVVLFRPGAVDAYPNHRLLSYPAVPRPAEPTTDAFAAGEALEFRALDFESAIAEFQRLADSADGPNGDAAQMRAGALLRLARNQRKAGHPEAALTTYAALGGIRDVWFGGQPADLVALRARCDLLAELGRHAQLEREAEALDALLHGGRWQLDRATYLHFALETLRWVADDAASLEDLARLRPGPQSLAVGVTWLWERWQQDRHSKVDQLGGRRSMWSYDRSVLMLWRGGPDRFVALVGGPGFLEHQLLHQDPLHALLERQKIHVALDDAEGRSVLSQITGTRAEDVLRTMAATGLPWTLRVGDADPTAGMAQLAGRRRLLLGGLGLVTLLMVAGSYFSARAMTRELETARLQSDFVAAVSHEFRTPLTSLRQFTDLLADGRQSSQEDRDQYYGALRRGTQRLTRLVENLLDFGRMDAGSHEVILQAVPAKDLVQRVVAEFQEEVQNRGYQVGLAWHGDEAVVHADATALERALWNLLDNAVKYSPRSRTIWVRGDVEDGRLVLSVRDQSIGIPKDEQSEVFRKFVRGAAATASAVKGTGLGLTLVRQIVEAHGGQVRLESRPGEGSTFSIVLPTQR